MRPEKSGLEVEQEDLFRSRLSSILDHKHPLYVLAETIDWATLEREFGAFYVENVGRPGLPTRLMVGLHYLKSHLQNSRRLRQRRSLILAQGCFNPGSKSEN